MLTHMGVTPSVTTDPLWSAYDVADLGLGKWVLIESSREPETQRLLRRASGIYQFGKWTQPQAPAVWSDDPIVGGINRDARYIWRAPNISDNTAAPPLPPQANDFGTLAQSWEGASTAQIKYDGPVNMQYSYGPAGGPGSIMPTMAWEVLDGSPMRWAAVAPYFVMQLQDDHASPVSAGIFINGKAYPCPGWHPWHSGTYAWTPYVTRPAWQRFGSGWDEGGWQPDVGDRYHNGATFEIGLGSRYGVALANTAQDEQGGTSRNSVDVCVADRSAGTARSARWVGSAFAGPLVKGNTAIFYGVPGDSADYSHPVVRVIMDLTAMTFKVEPCPDDHYAFTGRYAPSYMSDVPRLIHLATSGSGYGPTRLAMDDDIIEVSGETISYSGHNLLVRPPAAPPSRFQGEVNVGTWVELVVWTPDSNLAGGDDRPQGYFL